MLNKLVIKNVALIERAEICFLDGLNVLSGETGAGKSVIIDSLNFVLGAKADKSLIRSGETECIVSAEFNVSGVQSVFDAFEQYDFEPDDLLIITRKFSIDGKSVIKLNGNSLTVGMLRKFTSKLVDVYGQSEHFDLLSNANQIKLIDKYGGEDILKIKVVLNDLISKRKEVISELERVGGDENHRLIRLDLLSFQINEIENCALKEGEEQELKVFREKLNNQEKILTVLSSIKSGITDEGGIADILSNGTRICAGITNFGEDYSNLFDRLNSVYAEIDDVADSVSSLLDGFDFSALNVEEINERLEVIKSLKKKYGQDYAGIMQFLDNAKKEKDTLLNAKEIAEKLVDKKQNLEREIYDEYAVLDKERRKVAQIFSNNIVLELQQLGMKKAQFSVEFTEILPIEECNFDNVNAFNRLEFLFSANAGEEQKSLSNVISGGEMSRFMLALKSQTAKINEVSTFVFDEIDAGISGNTAKVVGEKFCNIAKSVQILAISHLPQISAMADNNILITKAEVGDRTITSVQNLDENQKILEVIRLSGGEATNSASVEHAKSIIENADNYKKSI